MIMDGKTEALKILKEWKEGTYFFRQNVSHARANPFHPFYQLSVKV